MGDVNAPAVADGSKVSLLDTDHVCGICGDVAWPWKSMMQGHNPLLMDGYDGSAGVGDPKYDPTIRSGSRFGPTWVTRDPTR